MDDLSDWDTGYVSLSPAVFLSLLYLNDLDHVKAKVEVTMMIRDPVKNVLAEFVR